MDQIFASQATRSETVSTAKTCEARIEPDVTPASSPYSFAMVKGPDPIGSALRITAECDHKGGIEKTWNASRAVTAGCRISFIDTSRAIEAMSSVTTRS